MQGTRKISIMHSINEGGNYYQNIFDFSDYGITCLSSNSVDYLPMWAYYTNNHKGFCVE